MTVSGIMGTYDYTDKSYQVVGKPEIEYKL